MNGSLVEFTVCRFCTCGRDGCPCLCCEIKCTDVVINTINITTKSIHGVIWLMTSEWRQRFVPIFVGTIVSQEEAAPSIGTTSITSANRTNTGKSNLTCEVILFENICFLIGAVDILLVLVDFLTFFQPANETKIVLNHRRRCCEQSFPRESRGRSMTNILKYVTLWSWRAVDVTLWGGRGGEHFFFSRQFLKWQKWEKISETPKSHISIAFFAQKHEIFLIIIFYFQLSYITLGHMKLSPTHTCSLFKSRTTLHSTIFKTHVSTKSSGNKTSRKQWCSNHHSYNTRHMKHTINFATCFVSWYFIYIS